MCIFETDLTEKEVMQRLNWVTNQRSVLHPFYLFRTKHAFKGRIWRNSFWIRENIPSSYFSFTGRITTKDAKTIIRLRILPRFLFVFVLIIWILLGAGSVLFLFNYDLNNQYSISMGIFGLILFFIGCLRLYRTIPFEKKKTLEAFGEILNYES